MLEHGFSSLQLVITTGMTLMVYLAFPGISARLWQQLMAASRLRTIQKICRREKERGGKPKKYWEIDIRNFK